MRGTLATAACAAAVWVVALGRTGAQAEPVLHGPPAAAAAILGADRQFSKLSLQEGMAAAFRDSVDPADGRAFVGAGDPAKGAAAIYAAEGGDGPAGGSLSWEPDEVFAGAGDMGASWGRWAFKPAKAGAKAVTGRYVTVWRKDPSGRWKGLIDIGNPDP